MPTYVHLVRHGQGEHNLPGNGSVHDPSLTERGRDECAALRAKFPHHAQVTHLVASPMRRTIQTCLRAFYPEEAPSSGDSGAAPGTGGKILCLPDLQEAWDWPCDTGSDPSLLADEFGTDMLDLSRVDPGWVVKAEGSRYDPTHDKLEGRARDVRVFLRGLGQEWMGEGDAHIVAVTHGSYINFVTDKWEGSPPGRFASWATAECRSFVFQDPSGLDPDAWLIETDESWAARKGDAPRPSAQEDLEVKQSEYVRWLPELMMRVKA